MTSRPYRRARVSALPGRAAIWAVSFSLTFGFVAVPGIFGLHNLAAAQSPNANPNSQNGNKFGTFDAQPNGNRGAGRQSGDNGDRGDRGDRGNSGDDIGGRGEGKDKGNGKSNLAGDESSGHGQSKIVENAASGAGSPPHAGIGGGFDGNAEPGGPDLSKIEEQALIARGWQ